MTWIQPGWWNPRYTAGHSNLLLIKAFCINASQLWNRLPISVHNLTSLPVFKQGGSRTMRLACFHDHTFAIIVILDLTPYLLRWYVQITQGSKYADTVTIFSKSLTKRSMTQMTPRWPLTPLLLRSHVQLYPRIIVSNSHKNTSQHVDTVTLFTKTLTKGQWPLDDLWPHFCCDHTTSHFYSIAFQLDPDFPSQFCFFF